MDGTAIASSSAQSQTGIFKNYSPQTQQKLLVINTIQSSDSVTLGGSLGEEAVLRTAREISDKIADFLKTNYPDQFTSLPSEQISSETAASNVINGLKVLYEAFKKQSESEGREGWQEKFFELARQGIQAGYDSALEFLDGLGALSYEGVKSNAEQTKILIETKLKEFEDSVRSNPDKSTENTQNEAQKPKNLSLIA